MSLVRLAAVLVTMVCAAAPKAALAEPYLAVQGGYKCNTCHVNPTGGGLRNDFGIIYAENVLPASTSDAAASLWSGKINEYLRIGGDLRTNTARTEISNAASTQKFALDQARLYGEFNVIPDRLGIVLDEQVAPNAAQNLEAYVRYGNPANGWYLKGGKFYLPFGWRLQDQTAFVREVSGISMTTPDQGFELGLEVPRWSMQLALTNGAANAQSSSGFQVTGQAAFVQPYWRVGLAASKTQADAGDRAVFGMFGGVRTGPLAWLAEADVVSDAGFPEGTRRLLGLLGEADWRIAQGHNLKLTAEYYDPDRHLREDQQSRWSILYELTPLPFLQLRLGYRRYRGIPQSELQNRRFEFLELHGYF